MWRQASCRELRCLSDTPRGSCMCVEPSGWKLAMSSVGQVLTHGVMVYCRLQRSSSSLDQIIEITIQRDARGTLRI